MKKVNKLENVLPEEELETKQDKKIKKDTLTKDQQKYIMKRALTSLKDNFDWEPEKAQEK